MVALFFRNQGMKRFRGKGFTVPRGQVIGLFQVIEMHVPMYRTVVLPASCSVPTVNSIKFLPIWKAHLRMNETTETIGVDNFLNS